MSGIPRNSLLGLPTELRLRIYDHVLGFDAGRLAIYDPSFPSGLEWRFEYKGYWQPKDGFGTRIVQHDASLPRISWLSLLSSCRAIRSELSSHMDSPASPQTDEVHTYEMAITGWGGKLEGVVWTSLPCTPEKCRVLTVNITLCGEIRFWGDGGPMHIVPELYQTLNRFMHYGPMLDVKTPLAKALKVDKLILFVKTQRDSDHHESLQMDC